MAKSKKEKQVTDYRYDETRKNNPPAGLAEYEKKVKEPQVKKYAYDPHLSPQLVWAGKPGLKTIEVEDKAGVEVETVSLHVHERVSTKAIINAGETPWKMKGYEDEQTRAKHVAASRWCEAVSAWGKTW